MTSGLALFLRMADIGMLGYWLMAILMCAGMIVVPTNFMYSGYGTKIVDAWNWSFAPLDIAFALVGLAAVKLAQRSDPRWRSFALLSLALTMCAGGMAISYWAILGDFELLWWAPNLALFLLPLFWLPQFLRKAQA